MAACLLLTDAFVTEAVAGVRGKSYAVSVEQIPVGTFEDTYEFRSNGRFVSERGGIGTWKELNLIVFSLWSCSFTDGVTHITLSGVQFGSRLSAVGSNQSGNTYQLTGTEVEEP